MTLQLNPGDIERLEILARDLRKTIQRRAQIILSYHQGATTRQIVKLIGLSPSQVRHWRRQFLLRGLNIFPDSLPISGSLEIKSEAIRPGIQPPIQTPSQIQDDTSFIASISKVKVKTSRLAKKLKPWLTTPELPMVTLLPEPGILPSDSMAEAGRKTWCFQFAMMLNHEAGTILGEDIEELHDMRVASRRMRAAFDVFGNFFDPPKIQPFLKGLRNTGRALGKVRDLDVLIEKVGHYLQELPEGDRPALQPLVDSWMEQRQQNRSLLIAYLEGEEYKVFKEAFNRFVQMPGTGLVNQESPHLAPFPTTVRDLLPPLIYTRLAGVRAFEEILDSASLAQLHALRIEFKKLRYTLEFFREVLGKEIREIISEIKILQDHLGDLNDADVACTMLQNYLEIWEQKQVNLPLSERQSPQPILTYLTVRHSERHDLLIRFPEVWQRFNRPEIRKGLSGALAIL